MKVERLILSLMITGALLGGCQESSPTTSTPAPSSAAVTVTPTPIITPTATPTISNEYVKKLPSRTLKVYDNSGTVVATITKPFDVRVSASKTVTVILEHEILTYDNCTIQVIANK